MAELNFNATTVKQTGTDDGIHDWMEINSSPNIEVFRVMSSASGDYFYSRKFSKVIGYEAQNHGATAATGVARDPPKISITERTDGGMAKVTITHSATQEVFTIILYGEA